MLKKAVQQGRSEPRARRMLRYVEPLSDTRTPLADFFNILLGGTPMYTTCPHDHEPARASGTSLYGNRWLKGYVRGKMRIDPMYGSVFEYSTPPQIVSNSDQSSSDPSGML